MKRLQRLKATGKTISEIASILDRSEGAIRSRLYFLDIANLATVSDPNATLVSLKQEKKAKKEVARYAQAANPGIDPGKVTIHHKEKESK